MAVTVGDVANWQCAHADLLVFLRAPDSGARSSVSSHHYDAPESSDSGAFACPGRGGADEPEDIAMNAAVDGDQPQSPATAATAQDAAESIDDHRNEIDHLDAEILRLIKRRAEVSREIGAARMAAGGPRIVYNREMDVLARYRELGAEGRELAMILLRLGRGQLGH
ncbi:hypothetical protein GCM10027563_36790 [Parasphingorhabdus pacifica]